MSAPGPAAQEFAVRNSTRGDGLPASVVRFLYVSVCLTLLCVAVEVFCRFVLHLQYPYTWPLMPREHPFMDFGLYQERFRHFHSAAFYTPEGYLYLYPAPLAAVHKLFFLLPHPVSVFLACYCSTVLLAACLVGRALVRAGVRLSQVIALLGLAIVCSYPVFFEFEQANLEWVLWALLSVGLWLFLRGNAHAAALCIGLAASLKFYPILFLALFVSRRQFRQALTCLLTFAAATVAGLWLTCPDLATSWRGTQHGLTMFRMVYVLRYEQVGFDHSLFGLVKGFLRLASMITSHTPGLGLALQIYLPVMALVGVVLYLGIIDRLPVINQVICLTVAAISLPPVSYDYTLLHLYAPWVLLVMLAVERRGQRIAGVGAALLCIAVVQAPETELILRGFSYGAQVKALALIALFVIASTHPFRSRYDMAPVG